jgi:hypothetical protein
MISQSSVYVYEITTNVNPSLRASVESVVLAILDSRPDAKHFIWTVALTMDQALRLRGLPWVITPGQLGQMTRIGDELVYRDPVHGETWSVSIEALAP